MDANYRTRIETVIVEVNGESIDAVSFTSGDQAAAYKRGVRVWAIERGLYARVYSQVLDVARRDYDPRPMSAPVLALAV